MSTPPYPNFKPVQAVVKRLQEACVERIHEFWPFRLLAKQPRGISWCSNPEQQQSYPELIQAAFSKSPSCASSARLNAGRDVHRSR